MAKLVIGTDKTVGVPAIVMEVEKRKKYSLLQRIKDDSNNDIGIVVGLRKDSNNNEYAVVCLNKAYRTTNACQYLSSNVTVSNLPMYGSYNAYEAPETATFNCDKILETATAQGLTSSAVTECRSHSFVIEGSTYYGQLPTILEIIDIMTHRTAINTTDPSTSGPEISNYGNNYWSSTQTDGQKAWRTIYTGVLAQINKDGSTVANLVIPVLELPNS